MATRATEILRFSREELITEIERLDAALWAARRQFIDAELDKISREAELEEQRAQFEDLYKAYCKATQAQADLHNQVVELRAKLKPTKHFVS